MYRSFFLIGVRHNVKYAVKYSDEQKCLREAKLLYSWLAVGTAPPHRHGHQHLPSTHGSMEFIVLYAAVVIHAPQVLRLYVPPSCSVRELVKIRVNTTSIMWLVLLEEKRTELGEAKVSAFCCDKCEHVYPQHKLSQHQRIVSRGLQASDQKTCTGVHLAKINKEINKSVKIKTLRPVTCHRLKKEGERNQVRLPSGIWSLMMKTMMRLL